MYIIYPSLIDLVRQFFAIEAFNFQYENDDKFSILM